MILEKVEFIDKDELQDEQNTISSLECSSEYISPKSGSEDDIEK